MRLQSKSIIIDTLKDKIKNIEIEINKFTKDLDYMKKHNSLKEEINEEWCNNMIEKRTNKKNDYEQALKEFMESVN